MSSSGVHTPRAGPPGLGCSELSDRKTPGPWSPAFAPLVAPGHSRHVFVAHGLPALAGVMAAVCVIARRRISRDLVALLTIAAGWGGVWLLDVHRDLLAPSSQFQGSTIASVGLPATIIVLSAIWIIVVANSASGVGRLNQPATDAV